MSDPVAVRLGECRAHHEATISLDWPGEVCCLRVSHPMSVSLWLARTSLSSYTHLGIHSTAVEGMIGKQLTLDRTFLFLLATLADVYYTGNFLSTRPRLTSPRCSTIHQRRLARV